MPEIVGHVNGPKMLTIARVELFTDAEKAAGDRELVAHFERATYTADGLLDGKPEFGVARVRRLFGEIAARQFECVDPVTGQEIAASGAGIAELLKTAIYQFREEDKLAAEAAAANPLPRFDEPPP